MSPEAPYSAIKVAHVVERGQNLGWSEATIEINGLNHCVINGSDAEYTVERGQVTFWLGFGEHERKILLKTGQSVFIPKGVSYQDMGFTAKMRNRCWPAFDPDNTEILW